MKIPDTKTPHASIDERSIQDRILEPLDQFTNPELENLIRVCNNADWKDGTPIPKLLQNCLDYRRGELK